MDDAYAWLEDIDGDDTMAWVRDRNALSEKELFGDPVFAELEAATLAILEADDRIAMPSVHGDDVTNVWTDGNHRRGLWRKTSWASYLSDAPDWETILDVSALGDAEGQSWVLKGLNVRRPDRTRALLELSPGGSDATTSREFDLLAKEFIPADAGGFVRPVAKGGLSWIDADTVYVMTDMGEGTLTTSGYPRTVREWKRGTALEDAPVVFEGLPGDVSVSASVSTRAGFAHHSIERQLTFYTSELHLRRDGELHRLGLPDHATKFLVDQWCFVELRSDWNGHAEGSLVVAPLEDVLAGTAVFEALFTPTETTSLAGLSVTKTAFILNILDDVRNRLESRSFADGAWQAHPVEGAPDVWNVAAGAVDGDESDDLWLTGEDFLTPVTLYRTAGRVSTTVKTSPARFDASGLAIEQRFVASEDGTRIPYFVVAPEEAPEGPSPMLLGGYGGFEVPRLPSYAGVLGRSWLAAGGSYVLANIRGGGEYGPRWHKAGLREQRPRVYEDFEAVARDLIARGDTTAAQLGCSGGSNGGLLVGNMYVRSPELWGAIVCQVPLLDMYRYTHLLAGASWMAEYGDPDDPEDWSFMKGFSPYHLIEATTDYPPIFLTTSTKDDRVHPGHARKMAARLLELGKDVTYWENIEGGHGGAADAPQAARMQALTYTFLRKHLMP